jgi:glucokinase
MDDRLIGVDVGGTKVSVAVLNRGELGEPHVEPTRLESADALLDQIVGAVQRAGNGEPYAAVGLGMPSVIDWETGRVRSSVNIPLKDVPVREELRERLGVPVYVDNDASVAALAEAIDSDVRNLVMLTIGTGVGGGVVIDGRVFRGTTGAAPELGHMVIGANLEAGEPQTRERFPQPGSLEALAAGTALDELARERGCKDGREVVARAQEGHEQACEAITLLGHRLGVGIANVINIFDPEVVAIGGGVSAAGELLLGPARETAWRFILPGVGSQTDIRLARSGTEAGVRGAALLAGQELELEVAT